MGNAGGGRVQSRGEQRRKQSRQVVAGTQHDSGTSSFSKQYLGYEVVSLMVCCVRTGDG
jgi:hypothetical protein